MLLARSVAGLQFPNPILLAAGTAGFGREVAGIVDLAHLGGLVTKAVSLAARDGNRAPRVAEVAGAMLNSVGPLTTARIVPTMAIRKTRTTIHSARRRRVERPGRWRRGRLACSEGYWSRRTFRSGTPSRGVFGMTQQLQLWPALFLIRTGGQGEPCTSAASQDRASRRPVI